MTNADKFIKRAEAGLDVRFYAQADAEPVCLWALGQAEPSNPDSAYGKKVVKGKLITQADRSAENLACKVPGCEAVVSKTDLELIGGSCKLALECLEETWRKDGSYEEIEKEGKYLGPGAFGCRNPLCDFSCGWSEDSVPGTDGTCLQNAPAG